MDKTISTKAFRTRQEFVNKENPKGKEFIIGLDAGYSSMKVFYENGYFCFPSYAKQIDEGNLLNITNENDILYRDEATGDVYMIGTTAQNMIDSIDTNDTDGELFSRKRYNNKKFKILCNTAIGIAIMDKKDNRPIVIQTGLPSSYVEGDTEALKRSIAKEMNFSLKIGSGKWKSFNLVIEKENIFVVPQPAGAMYSVMIDDTGKFTHNAKHYLNSNVLVMDIGFGTFDFYGIKNRAVVCKETIDEYGMREVLQQTSDEIRKELNEDIRVSALQQNLETGTVICINEDEMISESKPFGEYLEKSSEKIFLDAFERAKSVTNTFRDYKYLIVAGGTASAWNDKIAKYFSRMSTLSIIQGNVNDKLSLIYSNVRGYYLLRLMYNK